MASLSLTGQKLVLISFFVVASGVGWIGGTGCLFDVGQTRTITYDRKVPIAERLTIDDKDVFISKISSGPLKSNQETGESFDEEVDRLALAEAIAILRVTTAQSELIEGGTWVRTKITAEIQQAIKSSSETAMNRSVEFTVDGGTVQIGKVNVTAGSCPRFVPDEQYLVLLATDRSINGFYLDDAFHVNAQGVLERVKDNRGLTDSSRTKLVGRDVSSVAKALSQSLKH